MARSGAWRRASRATRADRVARSVAFPTGGRVTTKEWSGKLCSAPPKEEAISASRERRSGAGPWFSNMMAVVSVWSLALALPSGWCARGPPGGLAMTRQAIRRSERVRLTLFRRFR